MIITGRFIFALLALVPLNVNAQRSELWRYGCDYFMYGACLRVPNGMSVSYENPADYSIHRVRSGAGDVLTIYEGDSPQRPSQGLIPKLELTRLGSSVSVYERELDGRNYYDVYINSKSSGTGSVHLSAITSTLGERDELAVVLGGLRTCRFKRNATADTLMCPSRGEWGKDLADLVARPSSHPMPDK